jgi:hypothetical protein
MKKEKLITVLNKLQREAYTLQAKIQDLIDYLEDEKK